MSGLAREGFAIGGELNVMTLNQLSDGRINQGLKFMTVGVVGGMAVELRKAGWQSG